jgi:hypothetical protein
MTRWLQLRHSKAGPQGDDEIPIQSHFTTDGRLVCLGVEPRQGIMTR